MKKWLLALAASIALLLCLTGAALAEDPKLPTDKEVPSTVYAICPRCRSGDFQTTSNWSCDADTHYYEMQCSNCGSRWPTSVPNYHTWKFVEAKDPICTKIGWNAYQYCSFCYYHVIDSSTIKAPLGEHQMTDVPARAVSCTEIGWNAHRKCTRAGCDYKEGYVEIPTRGRHDYVVFIEDVLPATCHNIARGKFQCDGCTATTTKEYSGELLPHDLGYARQEPTCTWRGFEATNICRVCWYTGENNVITWLDPLGHDYSGPRATCLTDQVCARENCNEVLVSALGHDVQPVAAKKPTCTGIGWSAHKACDREGCDYKEGYTEYPALDHALTHHDAKKPTCTGIGWNAYDTCDRVGCGYTTYEELPALGHWYGEWTASEAGMTAPCKREDCDHGDEIECAAYSAALNDAVLTVCPVCGRSETSAPADSAKPDTAAFAVMDGAAVTGRKLPAGELVIRGAEAPLDGTHCAFTVCYELAGVPQPFPGPLTVTIPLNGIASQPSALRLVRADNDALTDLPFTLADGLLSFETNAPGLFLLLPSE